jgi:RNA polymerase sigma-70 factor (ECF subfamily)
MTDPDDGLSLEAPSATDDPAAPPGRGGAPSDESLLQDCLDGSADAAADLYRRYHGRVAKLVRARCSPRLASRLDVEDIVQSAFRSFFRAAGAGAYEVPDGKDLWQLLATIALNKVRAQGAFHRAGKRDVRQTRRLDFQDPSPAVAGKDPSDDVLLRLAIDEALQKLPPQQRAIVELRLEGYQVAEISAQVRRAKRTVERQLQQATAFLRALLSGWIEP